MKLAMSMLMVATVASLSADEVPVMPPPDQGFTQTLVMIAIALVFFYFILWRPEQKRRKTLEDQRSQIKKGDRVTAMGIVGTVSKILEQTIIVRMVDGSKIEFIKGAISEVMPATDEDLKKLEKEEKNS